MTGILWHIKDNEICEFNISVIISDFELHMKKEPQRLLIPLNSKAKFVKHTTIELIEKRNILKEHVMIV